MPRNTAQSHLILSCWRKRECEIFPAVQYCVQLLAVGLMTSQQIQSLISVSFQLMQMAAGLGLSIVTQNEGRFLLQGSSHIWQHTQLPAETSYRNQRCFTLTSRAWLRSHAIQLRRRTTHSTTRSKNNCPHSFSKIEA